MPVRDDNIGKSIQIESSKPSSKRNVQKDKRNKKKKKTVSRKYTIVGNVVSLQAGQDNPVNKITSDLVGATLSVTNPHTLVDTNRYPSTRYTLPTTYSTTISKVINETTFEVSEPYYVTDDTLQKIPVSLEQGSISITYDTYKTETENSVFQRSFAELTIGNLRTFSGDVYKAKVYTRDSHTSTDFEEIYDTFVVPENILVDSTSINGYENIGFFHTGSIIANNWVSSSTNTETEPFVSLNNEKLIDGVQISGSTQNLEDKVTFRTNNSFDLEQSVDYVVRFNSYYFKSISKRRDDNDDVSDVNHASLKIYLSGSAITGQNGEDDFFLGEVDVPDSLGDEGSIPDIVGRFRTAGSGSPKAWLKFELNSGRFIVQDVSIEPFSETNFNPSFFKVLAPMPKAVRRGDKYDFLVEFYDSNNNIAETTAQVNGVTFQGPRQVISDGLDGVLSGSLLVGQSLEMYGVNPAYLRSVGYNGFDNTISNNKGGFMLFSGSVGTRITASESYEGVGLEIVDAHSDIDRYLKFRTSPSQFEVVTDTFFFGRDGQFISGSGGTIAISSSNFFLGDSNGAFISGSQGNLQISSSNFSVDVDGNVTMSGFISASGGHIGNFQIVEGKISGSNITMDANTSTIFKTDQGPGSDPQAPGFESQADEYYIDFTPTEESPDNYYIKFGPNFMVDKDGILIASGATFVGTITASAGLIGGFTIGSASLFNGSEGTPNFFFSGSANGSNFDKGNLFISSSGFQVNSQGAISASAGFIGGFTIDDDEIKSGTTLILDANTNSGQIKLGSATSITSGDGIYMDGTGDFRVGDADGNRIAFDQSDGTLIMSSSKFFLGSRADGNSFVSGSGGNLEISSSFFHLSSSGHITGSKVKFTGGKIGGWTLSNTTLTGGTITLDSAGIIEAGGLTGISDTTNTGFYVDNSGQVLIRQGTNDFIKFSGGSLEMKARSFVLDANSGDLKLDSVNKIISLNDSTFANQGIQLDYNSGSPRFYAGDGSNKFIKFDGTNVEIESEKFELDANNLEISSTQASMSLGEGKIKLKGGSTSFMTIGTGGNAISASVDSSNKFISIGKSDFSEFDQSTKGFIVGDNGGIFRFEVALDAQNYMSFDGTANTLDIKTEKFKLDTDRLDIDSDNSRISVFDDAGSPKEVVRIGEVDDSANFGMKIFDGTGTDDTDILVEFSETENNIAGWDISTSTISKNNMIISSDGFIQSSGYSSGVTAGNGTGFILTAEGNGYLEVEKARIRGTLTTAVFEKETVNAVGGMLMVANSTAISESVGTSDTTMSVDNVNGFVGSYDGFNSTNKQQLDNIDNVTGEVVLVKKVDNTGFTTEYLLIQSSSFYDKTAADNGENQSGYLYVTRSFGGANSGTGDSSTPTKNSFATEDPAQSYTPGQVIASTGRYISGTGDDTTGTGYIFMNANPSDQYAPYIDIVERTGSKVYDMDLKVRLGDLTGLSQARLLGTTPSDAGFGLYAENAFLEGGIISRYGSIGGFNMDSTDLWAGNSDKSNAGTTIVIGDSSGTPKIALGGQADSITLTDRDGVYMDGSGEFRVGDADGDRLIFQNGNFAVTSSNFGLDAGTLHISSSNNGAIALGTGGPGSQAPTQLDDFGILLKGDGSFNLQSGTYDFIRNDGGSFSLSSRNTQISGSTTFRLHGNSTDAKIRLGTSADSITATTGTGVYIDSTGKFRAGEATSGDNFIYFNGSNSLQIKSTNFDLSAGSAGSGQLGVNTTRIALGSTLPTSRTSGNGFFVNNSGEVLLGDADNKRLEFDGTDLVIYGSDNDKIVIDGTGVDIYEGGTTSAAIAFSIDTGTVTIGKPAQPQTIINGTSLTLRDSNDVDRVAIGTNDVDFYDEQGYNVMNIDTGVVTIGKGNATSITTEEHIIIDGTGLTVKDGSTTRAIFGSNVTLNGGTITLNDNTNDRLVIGTDDVDFYDEQGYNVMNIDTGVVTIGKGNATSITTEEHIIIDGNGMTVKDGATTRATFAATSVIGSSTDKVTISDSGITIRENDKDVISMASDVVTIGSSTDQVEIDGTSGITIRENDVDVITLAGGVVDIGNTSAEHIEIDGSGLKVKDNTTTRATFAATSVIGSSTDKVTISDIGITIRENDADTISLASGVVTIGSSTDKVTISDGNITLRANNVDEFKVTDGQVDIGNTGGAQIIIDTVGGTSGIQVKDRDNAEIVFIGESDAIAGRTSDGSPLPTTDAIRGIVSDGLTANRAIITGSITAETFIGSTLDITGSANVGGLVTSGSVRNTSTGAATSVLIHAENNSQTLFQVSDEGEILARDNISAFTSAFTSISDKRLKTNVQTMTGSMDKILQLRPTKFTWKENGKTDTGFIAQEVEKIIPDVVYETKGFTDINSGKQDDEMYKTISYNKLTTYLVDTIQQLTKRIEELEKQNTKIEVD